MTAAPICGTPAASVTKPVIAPAMRNGVAACPSAAPARYTAPPKTSEATVLCVRATSIKRRSMERGVPRLSLDYRKLGKGGEHLFTEFVGNFHSQRVLPWEQVL